MKKVIFIISLLFSISPFAQVSNLISSTKDDTFLLDYFFNKQITKSQNLNYSFFSDKDFHFVGNGDKTDFFIHKPSIKRDDLWISFILVSNSSSIRKSNEKNFMSSSTGLFISCSDEYFIRRLQRYLYSKQYLLGELVEESDKPLVFKKNNIDKDKILSNIKNYICR